MDVRLERAKSIHLRDSQKITLQTKCHGRFRSDDGLARLWDVDIEDLLPADLSRI